MTLVAGKNRTNRPYFFTQSDGERMEVPSFGQGQGDLEGNQLREFRMYEQAGQITPATASIAPENTAVPTITGTAQVGQTLTGTNGSWTGTPAPTYSRQWKADGANISGATSATYKLTAAELGKAITLTVTATNEAGSASATSAATEAVVEAFSAPVNTAIPTIAGTARIGEVLTATNGTWSGNPTPTYTRVWQRGDSAAGPFTPISGATAVTYTPVAADLGKFLRVVVTGTNSQGSAEANSAATAAVAAALAAPVNTTAPAVTGTTEVGSVLTTTNGTWTGNPTPTYARAWQRSANGTSGWEPISGATATTYTLAAADDAHYIRCAVTGTNSQGSATGNSAAVGPVVTAEAGD